MKKLLFSVVVLAILGCGGDQGDLPDLFSSNSELSSSGVNLSSSAPLTSSSSVNLSSSSSIISGPTISHGGEDYEIIAIGTQTWIKRNLNYEGGKCSTEDLGCSYGKLYNWETAKTVCPEGWHLPTIADWEKLMNFLDPNSKPYEDGEMASSIAGKDLKASNGFNALFGGKGNSDGTFGSVGSCGYWWSATAEEGDFAYSWSFCKDNAVYWYDSYKPSFLSVRCVKN